MHCTPASNSVGKGTVSLTAPTHVEVFVDLLTGGIVGDSGVLWAGRLGSGGGGSWEQAQAECDGGGGGGGGQYVVCWTPVRVCCWGWP